MIVPYVSSYYEEEYNLIIIADFNGLIAQSQAKNTPVFMLTQEQVQKGGNVWLITWQCCIDVPSLDEFPEEDAGNKDYVWEIWVSMKKGEWNQCKVNLCDWHEMKWKLEIIGNICKLWLIILGRIVVEMREGGYNKG